MHSGRRARRAVDAAAVEVVVVVVVAMGVAVMVVESRGGRSHGDRSRGGGHGSRSLWYCILSSLLLSCGCCGKSLLLSS